MYKVGVTGGIGSGKSVVCRMLQECGAEVYNSDLRAKELMASDETLRRELSERFGEQTYVDGQLNRAYLAERVFGNKEELAALNSIVHPRVLSDFEQWAEKQQSEYVVIESAILFESGIDKIVDTVVAVMAPEDLRIERTVKRDALSREQVEERIHNQLSDDERCARSKYAVVNIDLDELEEDVEQLHRRLSYDARHQKA